MKRLLSYLAVSLLLPFVSCSLNPDEGPVRNGVKVKLTLNTALNTKATELGDDDFNENAINKLDCFFYTSDSDDVQPEVRLLGVPFSLAKNVAEITVSSADINKLFTSDSQNVYIYVVANSTADYTDGKYSVNEIKATEIEADFSKKQDSFVMDGKAKVSRTGLELEATVVLKRSASKIDVIINTKREIIVDGSEWIPDLEKSTIAFYNGVNKGHIDGFTTIQSAANFTNVIGRELYTVAESGLDYFKSTPIIPFYSYPWDWSDGANADAYLILTIYWQKKKEDGSYDNPIPTYYQLPISDAKKFERNNLYKAIINVDMLGSTVPEYPVSFEASYIVLNVEEWVSLGLSSDLVRYKYLVVDQNNYTLNNQNTITIPFYSSDECVIASVKVSYDKPVGPKNLPEGHTDVNMPIEYKNVDFVSANIYNDNGSQDNYSIDNDSKTITLTHVLNNDMSSEKLDYVPYTFTIILQHKGDDSYKDTINVIQNPAMYVIANTNYYYANNGKNGVTTNGLGAVFVNGVQGKGSRDGIDSKFGTVHGLITSTNSNPNMYTIVPTVLSDKYIIGDPRESIVDSDFVDNNNWVEAKDLTGNKRKLKTPLRTNSSAAYANMVAPRFRVASSYIVTTGTTKREQRCASYQEDGYPAGRWRVPTYAEVELVAYMTSLEMIPQLFDYNTDYHCAQGTIHIQAKGSSTAPGLNSNIGKNSVRCVYDEWYWGTDKLTDDGKGGVHWVSMEDTKNSKVKGTTKFIWAD